MVNGNNGKNDLDHESLTHLADELAEDILGMSDEELEQELNEDGVEIESNADELKSVYEMAVIQRGKSRMVAAKEELAANRASDVRVFNIDPRAALNKLEVLFESDPETFQKITLAARQGEGVSSDDVVGIVEDLEELGLVTREELVELGILADGDS
jgi:hypothetical protein